MDRIARPGDYLIVVDRSKLRLTLRSDDLVIVTQFKEGLREVTARRYGSAADYGGHLFAFESTDPRYTKGSSFLTSKTTNHSKSAVLLSPFTGRWLDRSAAIGARSGH
jgi:hypothetical protein